MFHVVYCVYPNKNYMIQTLAGIEVDLFINLKYVRVFDKQNLSKTYTVPSKKPKTLLPSRAQSLALRGLTK